MTIKDVFRPLYAPIINKYKAPKRYHHLYDSIREIKAARILEIGVWTGNRALKMIETAKEYNSNVEYFGFDLFHDLDEEKYREELSKRPPTKEEVALRLSQSGAKVSLYKGDTCQTLPEIAPRLKAVDFAFIDGGHSIKTIENDWNYVSGLMKENTIVIFDDYWRNRDDAGCKAIVERIDRGRYNVQILPEVDRFDNPDFGRIEISFVKVTKRSS